MDRSHERCTTLSSVQESTQSMGQLAYMAMAPKARNHLQAVKSKYKGSAGQCCFVYSERGTASAIQFKYDSIEKYPLNYISFQTLEKLCGCGGREGNIVYETDLSNSSQKHSIYVVTEATLEVNCYTSRISSVDENHLGRSAKLKMLSITPEILILSGRGGTHNRCHIFKLSILF